MWNCFVFQRKKESSRTSSKERLKDEKEKSKDKKEEKDGRKVKSLLLKVYPTFFDCLVSVLMP